MDRIRAITFDAFGTIIDTGRDALIRISDRIVRDHFLDVHAAGFLERWDVHFFGIDHDPFLTLAEATEVSLTRAFSELGIEADLLLPGHGDPWTQGVAEAVRQAKAAGRS